MSAYDTRRFDWVWLMFLIVAGCLAGLVAAALLMIAGVV